VHQEPAFCDDLSAAENLSLGALPSRHGVVRRDELARRAEAMLAGIGATLDVRRPVGSLTTAQRQQLQIAAAIGGGARVIVFDEPTSSLSDAESERLFEVIGRLKARGVTSLYVSHRMPEIFRLCDTLSVLRDGAHVATRPTASLTPADLVQLMIGRPLAEYFPPAEEPAPGDELLRVEGLSGVGFNEVSFSLRAGEVLGLAGLVGSGRSELARALFGIEPARAGRIAVAGRPVPIRRPADAIALGIGLVPEDRQRQGLVPGASVLHNITLPILRQLARGGWVRRAAERSTGSAYHERLRVKGALDATVAGLSGGNQQKVVLARWLAARSRVLILDEPTRGVDVGAKAELHALIGQLAADGAAVLLISSELPEVLAVATRILVLRGGRTSGVLARREATQAGLLGLMA